VRESAVNTVSLAPKFEAFFKASLKRIVPEHVLRERGVIIRLGPGAGRIYTRMRLLAKIGMNSINNQLVPANASSFVFVCFGNIMRSPMADALLKQAAAEAKISIRSDSAGLHAISGKAAHSWAQAAAGELGISLADHQAKLLTAKMIEEAEAIFAMDFQNLSELLSLYPQCKNKIFMLSAYAGNPRIHEISDPYLGDLETTHQCYRLLQTCVRNLLASRTQPVSPK
jgi:protein-tyrosine phosphatase